jgi:predicted CoA-binding protein
MTRRELIDDFLAQKKLALVGASAGGRHFGNAAWTELAAKGYEIFAVHPRADAIGGRRCWPDLGRLPERVGGVVISVPPEQTEKVVGEVVAAGIPRVWMQQGSSSPAAIRACEENGVKVVHGECILMFAEPAALVHRAHRWVWRILGKLPR